MKLTVNALTKSLNKVYLRQSIKREQIELFKANLVRLFERIRADEHEEHLKNTSGCYLGNTSYFIPLQSVDIFLLTLLNSRVSEFYSRCVFVGKQNGYYEVQSEGLEVFPIPTAADAQKNPHH